MCKLLSNGGVWANFDCLMWLFIVLVVLQENGKRNDAAQSALLRRHFLELTQSFIIPLERYLAGLMPLQKCISPLKVS